MREYESCFSPLIRDFITYRLASGRWNEASYGPNMRVFDRYCKVRYPDAVELTQEMVDSWCAKRGSETNNSCRSRIYVVHSFTLYLSERGLSSVHPPEIPRKDRSVYIPCAFTQEEIQLFFKACDSLPDAPATANVLICRITVPVFFRLLYSSGIRTTEARLLRVTSPIHTHGLRKTSAGSGAPCPKTGVPLRMHSGTITRQQTSINGLAGDFPLRTG